VDRASWFQLIVEWIDAFGICVDGVGVVESCSAFDLRVLAVGVGLCWVGYRVCWEWYGLDDAKSSKSGSVFFIHTFAELVVLRVVCGTLETRSKHTDTLPKHMPHSGLHHLHPVKAFSATLLICMSVFKSILLFLVGFDSVLRVFHAMPNPHGATCLGFDVRTHGS